MCTAPGQELRRLRRVKGMTLRELARKVTFDHSYLAAVERGDRLGSPLLAASVDEALDAQGRLVDLFAVSRAADSEASRSGVVELPDGQR